MVPCFCCILVALVIAIILVTAVTISVACACCCWVERLKTVFSLVPYGLVVVCSGLRGVFVVNCCSVKGCAQAVKGRAWVRWSKGCKGWWLSVEVGVGYYWASAAAKRHIMLLIGSKEHPIPPQCTFMTLYKFSSCHHVMNPVLTNQISGTIKVQ